MKLRDIEYVVQIARHHSINKAAKAMYCSQSFLSSELKQLEEELGYSIFLRNSQGVTLTDKGKEFLELGKQIQELVEQIENIGKEEESAVPRLQVCYAQSYHILDVLQRYNDQSMKKLKLDTREVNNSNVYYTIKENPDFIGIAYRYGVEYDQWIPYCEENGLEFREFYKEEIHVVVGKGNPLYDKEELTFDDLLPYEAVAQKNLTDDKEYQIVMPEFMQEHFRMSDLVFNDNRSKLYYIAKSPSHFGISVKWLDIGDPLQANGALRYIPIKNSGADRRIGIVTNKTGRNQRWSDDLLNYMRDYTGYNK